MQGTRLSFRSKEDAIHFAEKQGSSYSSMSVFTLFTSFLRLGLLRVRIGRAPLLTELTVSLVSAHSEVTRIPPKNYAENFLYQPSKLRLIRTK